MLFKTFTVPRWCAQVLFPAGNAEDRTIHFAEFSGIDQMFYFYNSILVEGIAQQVEHARVGEVIVVVAQGATKTSIPSLDPADNFHVDKVRGGPKPLPTS